MIECRLYLSVTWCKLERMILSVIYACPIVGTMLCYSKKIMEVISIPLTTERVPVKMAIQVSSL